MEKLRVAYTLMVIFSIFFSISSASAQELSVEEIVEKANLAAYYAGDDGKADVKMTITDKNGNERSREFTILRKNIKAVFDLGSEDFLVCLKGNAGSDFGAFAYHGQLAHGPAALIALMVNFAVTLDLYLQPLRKRVNHTHAYAVQTPGNLIHTVVKFASGV